MNKDRFAEQWNNATDPLQALGLKAVPTTPAVWKVNAVSAADIKPLAIRWLWPGWLAKGKLHILSTFQRKYGKG